MYVYDKKGLMSANEGIPISDPNNTKTLGLDLANRVEVQIYLFENKLKD